MTVQTGKGGKMKRVYSLKWVVCGLMITLLATFVANTGCKKQPEEIKIGAILPLTGEAAKYGDAAKKGIDLAIEEINSAGGIKGKKVQAVYEDSQGDPKLGVAAMHKLVTVDKVSTAIGDLFSSVTLAIAPLANKNKIVLLSPASSSPKITDAGDYIFRNCPSDVYEGSIMANYAYNKLGYRNVVLLYINNEYGVGIKDVFKKNFSEKGGVVVAEETFDQNATDFRSQLTKIKKATSEAIYLVGYKEMGYILKQAKEIGIRTQFLSTVMFEDPEILKIAKNAAEGVIYSASAFDPKSENTVIQNFVKSFEEKYNQVPDIFAGLSYDATKIMSIAITQGGYSGEGIKTAMYNVKNYPGVAGETSFDANGDAILSPIIKQVKNGKFVPIK